MREIRIKELSLKNFKGIEEFTLEADNKNISVYGENGSGKTSLFDGFIWLLFGKDSLDSSNFNIKTLDKKGKVKHRLDHQVSAVLNIDDQEISLRKVYKERWVRKRGEEVESLDGHTTDYFINNIPKKKGEYDNYLNNIIDEDIFKMLTNPLYFNTVVHWKDRRSIALELCDEVDNKQVLKAVEDSEELEELLKDKSIDDLKRQIVSEIRELKEERKSIPDRIDELTRDKQDIDVDVLKYKRKALEEEIDNFKDTNLDALETRVKSINGSIKILENDLNILKQDKGKELRNQLDQLMEDGSKLKKEYIESSSELQKKKIEFDETKNQMEKLSNSNEKLRNEFIEVRDRSLNENETICPTCNQDLPVDEIEKIKKDFEERKVIELQEMNRKGKLDKEKLLELESKSGLLESTIIASEKIVEESHKEIMDKVKEVKKIEEELENIKVEETPDYKELQDKLEKLRIEREDTLKRINKEDISNQIDELKVEIQSIDKQLALKELEKDKEIRVTELKDQERKLSGQIAKAERLESLCDEFIMTKASLLEGNLNSKFNVVEFKLFEELLGSNKDEIKIRETFVSTVDGVPFEDLNNAMRINAGLDIIKTLSEHYKLRAPIFLDNRESVNEINNMDTQIINLIVSKHKSLRVEVEK